MLGIDGWVDDEDGGVVDETDVGLGEIVIRMRRVQGFGLALEGLEGVDDEAGSVVADLMVSRDADGVTDDEVVVGCEGSERPGNADDLWLPVFGFAAGPKREPVVSWTSANLGGEDPLLAL